MGEGAAAGADFEQLVLRPQPEAIDQTGQRALVNQEVLAEALARLRRASAAAPLGRCWMGARSQTMSS